MPEMYLNLYARHVDKSLQRALGRILRGFGDDEEKLFRAAEKINPEQGSTLTRALLRQLDFGFGDMLLFEEVVARGGYLCAEMTSGAQPQSAGRLLVNYLHALSPDIRALAYGRSDEDPWECWAKIHNGKVVELECTPFSGNDELIKGMIYRWWHEEMPDVIREGLLNDADRVFDPIPEAQYQAWLATL